jgi:hypothetical protein
VAHTPTLNLTLTQARAERAEAAAKAEGGKTADAIKQAEEKVAAAEAAAKAAVAAKGRGRDARGALQNDRILTPSPITKNTKTNLALPPAL